MIYLELLVAEARTSCREIPNGLLMGWGEGISSNCATVEVLVSGLLSKADSLQKSICSGHGSVEKTKTKSVC